LPVLSHGHYDHTGEPPELRRINPGLKVCCLSGVAMRHLSLHPGKDIPMPERAQRTLASLPRH